MALSPEQLKRLPPSVAALLGSQSQGDQQVPQQVDEGANVLSNLQGAMSRRFGQTQDFDPTYDSGMRGLMGEVPQLQSGYENKRQRAGEDFTLNAEHLDRQNTQNTSSHMARMADRGLGTSGANLLGQEKIGEEFQRGVQGANTAYARGLDDMSKSQADAYRDITSRSANLESQGAERARVKDETRAWEKQQALMEQNRLTQEQQQADAALRQQQDQAAQMERMIASQEAQALASSQPMPTATGGYAAAPVAGGGSAANRTTDTNVSVWSREYNLRDPNEVKQLQYSLGLRTDGIMGPATWSALDTQKAAYFNDRPIDPSERLRQSKGTMYTYPGAR